MPKQFKDWSKFSIDISMEKIPKKNFETRFWRFYDDLSEKFLTVLRYSICLPFFKLPDKNVKVKKPNYEFDYCNARCEPTYGYDARTLSTNSSATPRTSYCSLNKIPDNSKHNYCTSNRNRPQLILRKMFHRRRRRHSHGEESNENRIIYVENIDNDQLEHKISNCVEEYDDASSVDYVANICNNKGDGPQNMDRLRRITNFFNDIYMEKHKELMKW